MGREGRTVKLPARYWQAIEAYLATLPVRSRDLPVSNVNAWVERAVRRDLEHIQRSRSRKSDVFKVDGVQAES